MFETTLMENVSTVIPDTCLVDVLFVTNQSTIPVQLTEFIENLGLRWAKVVVEEFGPLVEDLKVIGTIVLDTTEISRSNRENVIRIVKKLEKQNTAAILINNEIDFPFSEFRLATMLQSALPSEIQGRIETNVAYHKSLNSDDKGDGSRDSRSELAEDTYEQLKLAGQVQRTFLPKELPTSDLFKFSVLFKPADFVSGDIYDVIRLDEEHVGFYIADAVGHSMPAALLTMFLKHAITMRETKGHEYTIFPPVEVMGDANSKMAAQDLSGCLFATCCYFLLNTQTMELTFSRAGHPYPVLIRHGQEPCLLESRGGLLGVFEDADFQQQKIQLSSGDKIFLYSDGCETLVGECDDQSVFGFSEEFLSIADLPVEEMVSRFRELNDERFIARSEVDDVTVIGLEIF